MRRKGEGGGRREEGGRAFTFCHANKSTHLSPETSIVSVLLSPSLYTCTQCQLLRTPIIISLLLQHWPNPTNVLLPAGIKWQVGGAHFQHSSEGHRVRATQEKCGQNSLKHLMSGKDILGTILHQILREEKKAEEGRKKNDRR